MRRSTCLRALPILLSVVSGCQAVVLTISRSDGIIQDVNPSLAMRDLVGIKPTAHLNGNENSESATILSAAGVSSQDYPELACKASLMNRLHYADALQMLTSQSQGAVTGVVIQFDLFECQDPGQDSAYERCANVTEIPTVCDGLLATDYTPKAQQIRANATKATRYFHPLQQIWSRRHTPCPILHMPPDRVALSMTLLSDNHLHVRHLHVPMLVSSLGCWLNLTQPQQAAVTLVLSRSSTVGLAAPGVANASAELCQLRYAASLDFALLGSDNPNITDQEFAFSCCYADAPGDDIVCRETTSFSKWYAGTASVTFWGLFAAMLLGPLPFLSKLSPAMPSGGSGKKKMRMTAVGPGARANTTIHAADSAPESFVVLRDVPADSHSADEDELTPALAGGGAEDAYDASDSDEETRDTLPPLEMGHFNSWKVMSSMFYNNPEHHFAINTHVDAAVVAPPLDIRHDDDDEWWTSLKQLLESTQALWRLRWLVIMHIPLAFIALRAVAYRVSSTNSILQCMLRLEAPTPWFLFLYRSDYGILAVYILFTFVCLLANPKRLEALLKAKPDKNQVMKTSLFPTLPSGYHFPLTLRTSSGKGLLHHIWEVFKEYSLLWKIYRLHIRGRPAKARVPWIILCILAAIPDGLLLLLVALLAVVYNTPVGYVVIRWSRCAGKSVQGLSGHERLDTLLRVVVGFAWFVTFLAVYMVTLLSATWIVATLQYTIVGIVYNARTYVSYAATFLTIIVYLLHYWNMVVGRYNTIQMSVFTQYEKAVNQEELVARIITGVNKELSSHPSPATPKVSIPKRAFNKIVTEHYPVRFVVLKALLMFLAVCVYLAALNATVMLTGELEQYSTFTKSIAILVGAAVPKVLEFVGGDPAGTKQLIDMHAEDSIRAEFTKLTKVTLPPAGSH